jgi:outer membrane protein TolC
MKWIILSLAFLAPFAVMGQDAEETSPEPELGDTGAAEDEPYSRDTLLDGSSAILDSMEAVEEYLATQTDSIEALTGEPMTLTARRCVELALTQNAQVAVAQDDLEAARARIGQAQAQMKPQIKASMTFTHTEFNTRDISSGSGGLGGGGLGGGLMGGGLLSGGLLGGLGGGLTEGLGLQPEDDFRTDKVELNQVLYAGGQIRAAINASKYLAESQEWQKAATLAQLEYQAKQAFYDALASEALVSVAEASVKSFQRNLSDAQEMFDVGMVSEFEVLRSQTELGSREADLVEARNIQRLAHANLRRTIAVPQNTPLVLEPKLDYLPYTPEIDELVNHANEHRPEIQSLKKGIEAAKADVDRVRGQFKPQAGANVQWQNVDNGGLTQPDGWTFSLAGQWDIYAGGKRKHELVESKARLRSLEDQLRDLEALVQLDITQAYIQIRDSMARIVSERGNLEFGREGLRLSELRFQEGVGTQSETLDAELALTNAERSLVQAFRDLAVANATLERAIGKSWSQSTDEMDAPSEEVAKPEAQEAETAAP